MYGLMRGLEESCWTWTSSQMFNGQWATRKGKFARRQHVHNGSTLLAVKRMI
jgi:hypothetical protein